MNDRPSGGERVLLVHINFPQGSMEENLEEFKELAVSAGAKIASIITGTRRVPESKYFVGEGKAEEIQALVSAQPIDLVLFNHILTPAQERNLERLIKCRVLDRTGLILDIFAQRARSFEGKLQVELAFLKHLSTRLVRGWTHLERQRGGIGLRGGPGETQLETDRRLIRQKMKNISERLAKIRKQRAQGRKSRRKAIIPTVALVGYTNVGKSTLFNKLTGASVYAANKLFATLDPTLRRVNFPEAGHLILADTVGFIRHLPPDLITAFHATLEEVTEADILLHVVDAHDEEKKAHITEVQAVLEQIGAANIPCLIVYNKIDLCVDDSHLLRPRIEYDVEGQVKRVFVSAAQGLGMKELAIAIGKMLNNSMVEETWVLTPAEAKLRANLYAQAAIVSEKMDDEGNYHLVIRMPRIELEKLRRFR